MGEYADSINFKIKKHTSNSDRYLRDYARLDSQWRTCKLGEDGTLHTVLEQNHSRHRPKFAREMSEQKIQTARAYREELASIEERRAELEQYYRFRNN